MSTEKKLTAVEWLVENTPLCKNDFYLDKINEAKEKEKQHIIDFAKEACNYNTLKNNDFEDIYNETFKN